LRVKEHVKFSLDKMAKIALATTDRAQLDLYCVVPASSRRLTATKTRTRSTTSWRARAASSSVESRRLAAGDALVAPADRSRAGQ
jgi:hypothetical protein